MPGLLLTPDELAELTGARRRDAQARWLDDQRIPYLIGADRRPRVARATIYARLGVSQPAPSAPVGEPELQP